MTQRSLMNIENALIPSSQWQSDSDTSICNVCNGTIKPTIFRSNKHHCRFCGKIVCSECSNNKINKHRICTLCLVKKQKFEDYVKRYNAANNNKPKLSKLPSIPEYGECSFNLQQQASDQMMKTDKNIFISIRNNGKILEYNKNDKWMACAVVVCMAVCIVL